MSKYKIKSFVNDYDYPDAVDAIIIKSSLEKLNEFINQSGITPISISAIASQGLIILLYQELTST